MNMQTQLDVQQCNRETENQKRTARSDCQIESQAREGVVCDCQGLLTPRRWQKVGPRCRGNHARGCNPTCHSGGQPDPHSTTDCRIRELTGVSFGMPWMRPAQFQTAFFNIFRNIPVRPFSNHHHSTLIKMSRLLLRRGLLLPATPQPLISQGPFLYRHGVARAASSLADASFWEAMIPKFMRRKPDSSSRKAKVKVKKDWNPATFFICIFLMIGSMSIQMIALKKDSEAFTRHADVRIGLLREVIEKIQNGEEVDVEKVLGAGDPRKEATWEEGLQQPCRVIVVEQNADGLCSFARHCP